MLLCAWLMVGLRAEWIEAGVERIAAAAFAGATAYAVYCWMSGAHEGPQVGLSASAGGIAFLLCARALRSIPVEERFALPDFDVPAVEATDSVAPEYVDEFRILQPQPADELVLTDADRLRPLNELRLTDADRLQPLGELLLTDSDRLHAGDEKTSDELVLEDVLAELGPDSRVVRLFDPAAMPTPGQLNARIARHLDEGNAPAAVPDASQALYDALAELRRSLG